MKKNAKTFPRHLQWSAVLLLLIAGALLTIPQTALAAPAAITSITIESDPGTDKTYVKDNIIKIKVTYERDVTLQTHGGRPSVDFTIGSTTRKAGTTGDASYVRDLTFNYKVVAGDDDLDGIQVNQNGLKLNGGRIFDSIGNIDVNLSHAKKAFADHKVDTTAPTVSSIDFTSSATTNSTYKIGDTIEATVTFSEKVTVTGTPELTLTVGSVTGNKTADYASGSGSAKLVFKYTVAAGDEDTDGISIAANKLEHNGGSTIKDAIRDATLTHTAVAAKPEHKVDGVAPAVSSVAITSTAPTGDHTYRKGGKIQATVTFDDTVTVDITNGKPQLALTIGSESKKADYKSGTGSKNLVFEYTVAATDEDTDGISIAASQLTLNSGTIEDSVGNAATLTHTAVSTQTSHKVDGVSPLISEVKITSTAATDNTYKIDETIQTTVTFDRTVKVSGTPRLTLTIGESSKKADYASGSGTAKLVFEYTVAAGDWEPLGVEIKANQLSLNSGTIKSSANHDAILDYTIVNTTHQVDGVAPTIATNGIAITSTATTDNTYKIGEKIQATVTFSETVKVTGTPQLMLEIGSADKTADYESGTGSKNLVFAYTVAATDEDTDGIEIAADQLELNKGTITDSVGNDATLTHTAVSAQTSHKVDGVAPTVSSLEITSTGAPYSVGEKIQVTVTFSENVTVDTRTGTPELTLTIGSDSEGADYESGTGTTKLVFEYPVVSGDADTDGISIAANAFDLHGGTIKDSVGNDATLTHSALATDSDHKVDGIAPTITTNGIAMSSSATDNNNYYVKDDKIRATVTFSEKVDVTGTPQLTLTIGDVDKKADYESGTGTTALVFAYTVATGDNDTDGIEIEASAFVLNSGTIKDHAGNWATLIHSALPGQADHKVDAVSATITESEVTSTAGDDNAYTAGDTIQVTVTFSENVTVTGTPQLTLKVGPANKTAGYTSGSGTAKLVFEYTVVAGDTDTDGISIEANKLALNGGTIKDAAGNAATLTHDALNTQADHQVDTTAPTIVSGSSGIAITSTATNSYYKANDTIEVTVTFSEAVNVTGTPQLALTIGTESKKADYESGSGTTALVFAYTVGGTDSDTDGISIAVNQLSLNSGTIEDIPGNTATLTHTALATQASHKVDGVAPEIATGGISITSTVAPYTAGEKIQATVTFNETVAVTGTPQLTLTIGSAGKAAGYTSGTGTTTLVFEYRVVSGDEDTDGISIAKDALALNGGTIKGVTAGNPAALKHAALATQASHTVDAVAPTITTNGIAITSTPTGDKTYRAEDMIQVTVTFSEAVTVDTTGGTPTLTLKIGTADKIANYASGSGTTALVFEYKVVSGDTDTDGISIGMNQLEPNNGSIKDAVDNDATLTHTRLFAQTSHKVDTTTPNIIARGVKITSKPSANKTYKTGERIQATVTFSETVYVEGTPTLTLKIGTADKKADYTSGSGSAKLVFEYLVVSGDTDTDGIGVEANKLERADGTVRITDAGDNLIDPLHRAVPADPDHKVDGNAPGVATNGISITSTPGPDNIYTKSEKIQATVTFTEKVNVTGTPTLTLKIGTESKTATYTSGSGSAKLVFEYTVVAGDGDTDGIEIERDKLSRNGGTIKDLTGNAAVLTHKKLATQANHIVDAAKPMVKTGGIAITSSPGTDKTYGLGDKIQVTVTFNETVTVTGTPTLTLIIGTENRNADYTRGSGTANLIFEYTVQSDDVEDTDGVSIDANQLAVENASIRDGVGNDATLTHEALPAQADHKVSTAADLIAGIKPSVRSLAITSTGAPYSVGETIEATVSFSETVTVVGTPQLTLKIGTKDKTATYTRGSGSAKLVFAYTVASGDNDTDGIAIEANKLSANGSTIKDSDDNDADLKHTALSAQSSHTVDTTSPSVSTVAITSSPSTNGTYKIGETIQATVTFSEIVWVTGTPQLTLTIGNVNKKANWTSGSGSTSLVFGYKVQSGDVDEDGISITANTLALNNGAIKDTAGNAATLTHDAFPWEGAMGGIAQAQAGGAIAPMQQTSTLSHKVDGVSPSIVPNGIKITSTPASNNTYKLSEKIQATVTFTENVKVTGTPQLTLTIGYTNKTATYNSGHDTKELVFEYTVQSNDVDLDGISIYGNKLSGTLKDKAGNVADLTHAALTTQASHKVDTVVPTIRTITITSIAGSNNTYQAGEKIQAAVTFSEKVTVTGEPTLTLKVGTGYKNAAYGGGTGTNELFFAYTVASGDVDEDGISIDANQLNGGTITDIGGNAADLKNTRLSTQPAHKVGAKTLVPGADILPTISLVSLTSTGPYGVWDNIVVRVATTKPVTVTGSPTVAVVIGNTEKRASYQSGSGSASLVFQYTVASSDGDDPNGVSVKANSLSGGTLKDTTDNLLDLNHPALPDQGPTHQVDTTAPQVSSLAFSSTGPYNVGSKVQVTATISESITVTGAPSLKLLIGSTERTASYQSGTGTASLVFEYTVASADTDDADGVSVKTNSLALNGGTLEDAAGNALRLSHSGISSGGTTHAVGVTASGISSVAFTSTGPYKVGDIITLTVTTTETATVTETPRIRMTVGRRTRYADYVSGSGSTALGFEYTVVSGDADTDGIEIPQNALRNYRRSAIKNSRQTDVNLSHAGVEASPTHIVDTTEPEVAGVAFATEGPKVYTAGSTVEVIVTFAETGVQVTSGGSGAVPSLSLLFGSNTAPDSQKMALEASYTEARPGSTKLVFTYTVTTDTPVDADGVQIKASSLKLPAGASITDITGNVIEATPTADGSSLVAIKPASGLSSRPVLPSLTSGGIVFNEFMNAKADKHDWVELRNTTESEVSLSGWKLDIAAGGSTGGDSIALPDTTLSAGAVLLLLNTAHKQNRLERSDAYSYRYLLMPKLLLRGSDFSLMLRDRSGTIADVVSNQTSNAGAAGTSASFVQDEAYFREQPSTPGYEISAWQPSGYQGGLGYDRKTGQNVGLGTPGYLQNTLTQLTDVPPVSISEIMFSRGKSKNLPQWIELYNESKTEVITLQGWRLQLEVYDPSNPRRLSFVNLIIQKALRILPNQTVLIVTKGGRNSKHFPSQRVYNLTEYNSDRLAQLGPQAQLIEETGYAVVLRDEFGNLVDVAGNLDGDNSTSDVPSWKMLKGLTPKGFRTSIIRQYEKGQALDGTQRSNWFQAADTRRTVVTYWGHPKDKGNPGWKKGGPLPVQLSSFCAERTDQGAVIQWTTESALENAGFNVLRSDSRTGTFKVITPRMLQGAGTTSERSTYSYVDTTAKEGVAYYYRLEEVSFEGVRQPLVTSRLRGHVSAGNRYLTTFGGIKKAE